MSTLESGERTIPLCNLTMSSLPPCTVYGTQQEYDEYESGSLSVMDNGWNVYIAQQCQRNHGIKMANYAAQIGDRTAHLVNMCSDPTYWYSHYCTRLHTHVLNIPWIMDDEFLCSGEQYTNEWGGPPDWVVLPEGDFGSPQADIKTSTRLPIQEGCLHMDTSCSGNGQSGECTDSPGE